jgi:hypothetical protein
MRLDRDHVRAVAENAVGDPQQGGDAWHFIAGLHAAERRDAQLAQENVSGGDH